jgi:hypothetical protein
MYILDWNVSTQSQVKNCCEDSDEPVSSTRAELRVVSKGGLGSLKLFGLLISNIFIVDQRTVR